MPLTKNSHTKERHFCHGYESLTNQLMSKATETQ